MKYRFRKYSHPLSYPVYKDPDTYNPEREDPELVKKYSYLGFGGGRHACMVRKPRYCCCVCFLGTEHLLQQGENFAYLQIKTIWSVLLRNFDMEVAGPLPKPDYKAMVVGM